MRFDGSKEVDVNPRVDFEGFVLGPRSGPLVVSAGIRQVKKHVRVAVDVRAVYLGTAERRVLESGKV